MRAHRFYFSIVDDSWWGRLNGPLRVNRPNKRLLSPKAQSDCCSRAKLPKKLRTHLHKPLTPALYQDTQAIWTGGLTDSLIDFTYTPEDCLKLDILPTNFFFRIEYMHITYSLRKLHVLLLFINWDLLHI